MVGLSYVVLAYNPELVGKRKYSILFIYLLCPFRYIMDGGYGLEPSASASVIVEPSTSKSGVMELEAMYETEVESPGRPSSPDCNCSICLGAVMNKAFTNSCVHQFCFTCLKKWSEVKLSGLLDLLH